MHQHQDDTWAKRMLLCVCCLIFVCACVFLTVVRCCVVTVLVVVFVIEVVMIEIETDAILRRIADPFTTGYYQRIEADLTPLVTNLLAGEFRRYLPAVERPARRDLNSDLFPRDEFMVP